MKPWRPHRQGFWSLPSWPPSKRHQWPRCGRHLGFQPSRAVKAFARLNPDHLPAVAACWRIVLGAGRSITAGQRRPGILLLPDRPGERPAITGKHFQPGEEGPRTSKLPAVVGSCAFPCSVATDHRGPTSLSGPPSGAETCAQNPSESRPSPKPGHVRCHWWCVFRLPGVVARDRAQLLPLRGSIF